MADRLVRCRSCPRCGGRRYRHPFENGGPVVGSLTDAPDPVLTGPPVTLTASGMCDLDGETVVGAGGRHGPPAGVNPGTCPSLYEPARR